ncbi:class I SAM-dependent methyltransferase [Roseomonas sp. JC162]|uniref:Class I SAM-dependent methyltransferase n=1 Tax=Neoroseomonas marina TaxID=1232220 RepID=A0A848EFW6_9PROT|nr:class I SAM-dependent methyltransferase [Neoroseomonas marina]NMJ42886.1 class I SAM-dependent methyltransferase [Neoroseomonas marina]
MNEEEAGRIVGLYRRHAAAWAAARGTEPGVEAGWLARFAALLPPKGMVLDLGCGPGRPVAAHLASLGHAITGVDSSPEMIAMAQAALPGHDWIVADMRGLALGRRFDALLAWDSFFHLCHDDQRAMFRRFADHAAPGAALMFTSGPSHGIAMGRLGGEPLFHASLDAAEYRSLLAANRFAVQAHVANDPECGGHTVWLARRD